MLLPTLIFYLASDACDLPVGGVFDYWAIEAGLLPVTDGRVVYYAWLNVL